MTNRFFSPAKRPTSEASYKRSSLKIARKGQSEMMGFMVIILMLVVIGVVFLSFSANDVDSSAVNDFELESFVQSVLGYTTDCQDSRGDHLPLRKVIFLCGELESCYSGEDACEEMNKTLSPIMSEAWKIGEDWPTKGYSLQVFGEKRKILNMTEGTRTNAARSSGQKFESGIAIDFIVYR